MLKDEFLRTATCPCCGRTVHYRTKSEKRSGFASGGGSVGGDVGCGECCIGCAVTIGIVILIIIALPFILLDHVFGDSVWSLLGNIFSFLFECIWSII